MSVDNREHGAECNTQSARRTEQRAQSKEQRTGKRESTVQLPGRDWRVENGGHRPNVEGEGTKLKVESREQRIECREQTNEMIE